MSTKALRTAAVALLVPCGAETEAAGDPQEHRVEVEHRLAASPAEAWRRLGRFCAIAQWQSLGAAAGAAVAGQLKQLFDHGLRGIDSMFATAGMPADPPHRAASAPDALVSSTKGSPP